MGQFAAKCYMGRRFATTWAEVVPMQILDIKLLSAALRVKWDHHTRDRDAVRLLRERVPGHDDGEYAEAFRLATRDGR